MSYNGFIGLGTWTSTGGLGTFVESAVAGYARLPITITSPQNGRVNGVGAIVNFTTSAAASTFNSYAFYAAITSGPSQLIYPLNANQTFSVTQPWAFNPYSISIDVVDGLNVQGVYLDQGGCAVIAAGLPWIMTYSFQGGYAARAGGGQALATQMIASVNRIATVATAGDSVKLPPAVSGTSCTIINATAVPMQVFCLGTDTINNLNGQTVGVSQPGNSVDTYWCAIAPSWVAEVGAGFSAGMMTESSQDTITAFAGGGQGSATLISTQTARVTTIASANDSIKLPASAPGLELLVMNHGANTLAVYGTSPDTIDDNATATGVRQMVSSMCIYACASTGAWYSEGIGTGYAGSFPTVSFVNGLTALAGGGQAGATPLTAVLNRIGVCATGGDSVLLPPSFGGMQITVANSGAASTNVFPSVGEQINTSGANVAFGVGGSKTCSFYCCVAGTWNSVLSV